MSKKEKFIEEIEAAKINFSEDARTYFEALKITNEGGKQEKKLTENGKMILSFVREHKSEYNNLFSAKVMGEALGVSSRTVSGSARSLVTKGYLEKMGENPVIYSLTAEGEEVDLEEA